MDTLCLTINFMFHSQKSISISAKVFGTAAFVVELFFGKINFFEHGNNAFLFT